MTEKFVFQSYKEFLEESLTSGAIKDYKNHSTDTTIDFLVELPSEAAMEEALKVGLLKKFKLTSAVATSNMVRVNERFKKKQIFYFSFMRLMTGFV